jgi:hypothetical protein
MGTSKDLLEILACPKCKGGLRLTAAEDGLICDRCRLLYEIRDEIPNMLIDEAKPIEAQAKRTGRAGEGFDPVPCQPPFSCHCGKRTKR